MVGEQGSFLGNQRDTVSGSGNIGVEVGGSEKEGLLKVIISSRIAGAIDRKSTSKAKSTKSALS